MTTLLALLGRLLRRASILLHLDRRERDINEEMRFHLDMEARELARGGLSAAAAEREAKVLFGGVERYKEDARDAYGVRLIEDLRQDLRYAARQYAANPAFALAMVLTLSLGIGASTVMYGFTKLNPVPFDDGDRLVYIRQYSKDGCPSCQNISGGNALELATSARTLESVSLIAGTSAAFRGREHSEVVRLQTVTPNYFHTVGVTAFIGTTFGPGDTLSTQTPVAVISEPMWRTRLGANPAIVGRDIVLDGRHYVVRGVIAAGYEYPERTDVWTIRRLTATEANDHASNLNFLAIGRLRADVTLEQAASEAQVVSARMARAYPDAFGHWTLGVLPLRRFGGFDNQRTVAIFLTAVGFVLFVSCINLAGLLVARLTRRRRELAVRAAMGASSARVTRQLLTETVLVCLAAGLVGSALAHVALTSIMRALPENVAPAGWTRLHLDWGAFAFALGLGTIAGVSIGLWPSMRFARADLNIELRDGSRSTANGGASGGERVRRVLVVAELALSLMLVAAAGLLTRSAMNVARAPVGFSSDHVLTISVQLPVEIDGKRVESLGYFDRLADEIARVPGVTSAGAVAFLPLSRSGYSAQMFQVEGRAALKGSGGTRTQVVTPGYFKAFKIPLLRGRAITDADADSVHRVALVNETLARRFFADDDPLGRVLVLASGSRMTVVGIVGDVKQQGATSDAGQEILIPAATVPRRSMNLVIRTVRDPADLSADIVRVIGHYDPNLAINRVRTMDRVVDDFVGPLRVEGMLMAGFAVVAVVIATMGMYAIASSAVSARTQEFGVRLALGATRGSLLLLVLGHALRLVAVGVVIGLAGSVAATRVMRSMLFDVRPGDPMTIAAAGAAICAVAIGAALLPARRAMVIDPVRTLRED